MARARTSAYTLNVWPAFTDAMLAFVLVLVLVLVFQVARIIKIDDGAIGRRRIVNDIQIVEQLVSKLPGVEIVRESETTRVITFGASTLFQPAKADLQATGQAQLLQLAREVSRRNVTKAQGGTLYQIEVSGHTDNTPMNTFAFHSNWELSTARASNVVHFLSEQGGIDPSRVHMSAAGYGEFSPKAANDTETNRSRNRRIEVKLYFGTEQQ